MRSAINAMSGCASSQRARKRRSTKKSKALLDPMIVPSMAPISAVIKTARTLARAAEAVTTKA